MRRLLHRPLIPPATQAKLQEKTLEIAQIQDLTAQIDRAQQIYNNSRQTNWFQPIITALIGLCGNGALCMYCSSNEPSQVEHYRPIAIFPDRAMEYENYLWSCDICNRTHKGDKFPPTTEPGEMILNPLDDDVWEHFFIEDKFGRLLCRVNPETDERLPRADSTCSIVGIDREIVQEKRTRRFRNLRRDVERLISDFNSGTLQLAGLRNEITELRSEPFQADVADYFLNGPGRDKEPFRSLLIAAGEIAT